MEKTSKNHVLSLEVQEENDKKAIRNIIETYDIEDAIGMLYVAIGDIIRTGDNIDARMNKIDSEIKEARKHTNDYD